jgi:hypothetical protein
MDDVQAAALLEAMKLRFLDGEDHKFVDYPEIDNDVTLDDFWAKQETLDAQERYFDAD